MRHTLDRPLRDSRQRFRHLLLLGGLMAALAANAAAQSTPQAVDAGHSYAGLWMGRETEATVIVNVGVAQVGGNIKLVGDDPAASTLEFALVPGGEGAALLAPDGTLRNDALARLMRYTTMTFRSARARVRRDGYLEFAGELAVTHVTREQILPAWNSTYVFPTYTDPEFVRSSATVNFVLATPRAEYLAAYLQKNSDLVVTATVDLDAFPKLPGAVLDSFWPAFAQDTECPAPTGLYGVRDNINLLCHGKAISTIPSLQAVQTFGLDYSGRRKNNAPTDGPVTILLHLKLAAPPPTPPKR